MYLFYFCFERKENLFQIQSGFALAFQYFYIPTLPNTHVQIKYIINNKQ